MKDGSTMGLGYRRLSEPCSERALQGQEVRFQEIMYDLNAFDMLVRERGIEDYIFPPAKTAERRAPAAFGGDLVPQRVLTAYASGYFPWPDEEAPEDYPLLWWSPDPRCLLPLDTWTPSRTLRKLLKRHPYRVTVDETFAGVIDACAQTRCDGLTTWINPAMRSAYEELHRLGFAHSVETWDNGQLVGGLYGIALQGEGGLAFFGESMFYRADGASKVAFCFLIELLRQKGAVLFDCQMPNDHLLLLGAKPISRMNYLKLLASCRFTSATLQTPVNFSAYCRY